MVDVILSWHYICKYCLALGVLGNYFDKKFNADGVADISVATECENTVCPHSTMILNKESGTSNKGVTT